MSPRQTRRVCFYFVATHLGGAERSVLGLLEAMVRDPASGYRPVALLPKLEGPLVDELKKCGIECEFIPMPDNFLSLTRKRPLTSLLMGLYSTPAVSAYLVRLQNYLRSSGPDLLYSVGIKCHLLSGILSPLISVPVLWHLRDILSKGPTASALRTISRLPNVHLAAVSEATAKAFSGPPRRGQKAITTVYDAIEPADFPADHTRQFNQAFGVPATMPIVGIVGVVARWKGQLEFLRMARKLLDSGVEARFVIVGSEIYDTLGDKGFTRTLEREVTALKLEGYVRFTGYINNPAEAINGLDVLVHASIEAEPFGRVLIEAMSCEVPVVASRDGGVVELVEDNESGVLCEPGKPDEMAAAVRSILTDATLRSRLINGGKKRFLENFTNERHFRAIVALFDQTLHL